jgi:hypothetical protein
VVLSGVLGYVMAGPVVVAEEADVEKGDACGRHERRARDHDDGEVPAWESWPLWLGHAAQISTLGFRHGASHPRASAAISRGG